MRKNSRKNIRINNEVQKELSKILRDDLKDPRVGMMTSITDVEVAPDLKTCKVYVSILGSEEEQKDTMDGLKNASGFIRRQLASGLNLRNTPEIIFLPDHSIAYGIDMIQKIDELTKDLKDDDEITGDAGDLPED